MFRRAGYMYQDHEMASQQGVPASVGGKRGEGDVPGSGPFFNMQEIKVGLEGDERDEIEAGGGT